LNSATNNTIHTIVFLSCDWLLVLGSLTQNIRNFAKSLEGWLKKSMAGVPDEMIKTKVNYSVSQSAQHCLLLTSEMHNLLSNLLLKVKFPWGLAHQRRNAFVSQSRFVQS